MTDKIVSLLENGTVPWLKPWNPVEEMPVNAVTKRPYHGVNVWMLLYSGFTCRFWATFKQINDMGGKLKKGSKGQTVVFWNFIKKEVENKKGELEIKTIPLLRVYTVFNLEQCENIEIPENNDVKLDFTKIDSAEEIIMNMKVIPVIKEGGDRAYYSQESDSIQMPKAKNFKSEEGYYATLFHELSHSTGHKDRLNRNSLINHGGFGSHEYSKEELVAEFSSSFLCAVADINKEKIIKASASYIKGWSKKLQDNPKWLVSACGQATKSANYILGIDDKDNE